MVSLEHKVGEGQLLIFKPCVLHGNVGLGEQGGREHLWKREEQTGAGGARARSRQGKGPIDRSKRQMGSFLSRQNYFKLSVKKREGLFGLTASGVSLWFRCADLGPVVRQIVTVVAHSRTFLPPNSTIRCN